MKRSIFFFPVLLVFTFTFLARENGKRQVKNFSNNQQKAVSYSDSSQLIDLLRTLAAKEQQPLLKRHFESVALMAKDTAHGYPFTKKTRESLTDVLTFFQGEGQHWETYLNGPRPLMMAFKSAADGKNSFYWLFLPKKFDPNKKDYPFFLELHGSGGGSNDDPRQMLFDPLRPTIAGVTNLGYRKEGLFILPWGRGDKGYRGIAETDIFECLQDFDSHFKTDPARQYMYGFSMGGAGTFRIAQKSLQRWAAIGLYSADFRNISEEEAIPFKDFPVWMAWGETESWAVNCRLLRDYLVRSGARLDWREVKGVGHNYLGDYQDKLIDWLLQQKK